jgi:hypothetical protein
MADEKPTGPVLSTRDLHFAALVRQLDTDPKYRRTLHAMIADKFPEASAGEFVDVEVAKHVQPIVKRLADHEAKLAKQVTDNEAKVKYDAWVQSLVDAGIPRTALPDVIKVAHDRNNADPVALKLYYDSTQRAAEPSGGFGRPGIPGATGTGEWFEKSGNGGPGIMQDRAAWTIDRASQIWQEEAAAAGRR